MADTNIKCSHCKRISNISDFEKNGKILKNCIKCRVSGIKSKNKHKCIHNRQKQQCIECLGSSICVHKKQKSSCKLCSDEIEITIQRMIDNSKQKDKKNNKYDIVNFIDKCFVKNLIEDCNDKCYYCQCDLQYMVRQQNLATIERINNNIGHIKSNVVIACFHCNCIKAGNKLN